MEGLCPHSQGGLSLTHLHRLPHGHKEREGRVPLRHHHVATCASLAGQGGDLAAAAQTLLGPSRQNHRFRLVAPRDAGDVMSTDAGFQVTLYFGVIGEQTTVSTFLSIYQNGKQKEFAASTKNRLFT